MIFKEKPTIGFLENSDRLGQSKFCSRSSVRYSVPWTDGRCISVGWFGYMPKIFSLFINSFSSL